VNTVLKATGNASKPDTIHPVLGCLGYLSNKTCRK